MALDTETRKTIEIYLEKCPDELTAVWLRQCLEEITSLEENYTICMRQGEKLTKTLESKGWGIGGCQNCIALESNLKACMEAGLSLVPGYEQYINMCEAQGIWGVPEMREHLHRAKAALEQAK